MPKILAEAMGRKKIPENEPRTFFNANRHLPPMPLLTSDQVDKVVSLLLQYGGSPSLVTKKWNLFDSLIEQPSKNSIKNIRVALCAWILKENNAIPTGPEDRSGIESAAKLITKKFHNTKKMSSKYKLKAPQKLIIEVISNHYYLTWINTEETLPSVTELYLKKASTYAHSIAALTKNKKRSITSVYEEAWEGCMEDRSNKRYKSTSEAAVDQERFLTDAQIEYLKQMIEKGTSIPDIMDNDFITPKFIRDALLREFKINTSFDPCPLDRALPDGVLFNGLSVEWPDIDQGIIFINPPYSKTLFQAFIAKAILYVHESKGTVIALTHRKPLTSKYWTKLEPFVDEIRELHTRINFKASDRLIKREEDTLEQMKQSKELLHKDQIEKQERRLENLKGFGKTPHSPVLVIIRPIVSSNRERKNVPCIGNDTRLAYTSVFPCITPLKKDDI